MTPRNEMPLAVSMLAIVAMMMLIYWGGAVWRGP